MTPTMTPNDLIRRLQTVRKEKHISYQDIVDKTEEMGMPVSLSTVKRVFGPGAGNYEYRYETTIKPIATVLLGDEAQGDSSSIYLAENAALKSMTAWMGCIIDEKTREIENHQKVLKHKNRMEIGLCASLACLALMMLAFYIAHTVHLIV